MKTHYDLKLFPNSASNQFIVERAELKHDISCELSELGGEKILKKQFQGTKLSFDLDGSNPAVYLLQVIENKKILKTFRIVKI